LRRTAVAGRQVTASEMTGVGETRNARPVRLKPDPTSVGSIAGGLVGPQRHDRIYLSRPARGHVARERRNRKE